MRACSPAFWRMRLRTSGGELVKQSSTWTDLPPVAEGALERLFARLKRKARSSGAQTDPCGSGGQSAALTGTPTPHLRILWQRGTLVSLTEQNPVKIWRRGQKAACQPRLPRGTLVGTLLPLAERRCAMRRGCPCLLLPSSQACFPVLRVSRTACADCAPTRQGSLAPGNQGRACWAWRAR